jgi:hypothetical protein
MLQSQLKFWYRCMQPFAARIGSAHWSFDVLLLHTAACRDVMDQLAAALAGYGSHVSSSSSSSEFADEVEEAAAAGSAAADRRRWRGVSYVRVDGSHDSTERLAAVRRFKADPSVRVALLSITAAAVGESQTVARRHRALCVWNCHSG